MVLKTMYPPQKDSPTTFLLGDISSSDTLITLGSAAILPKTFPYPLTLGIDKTITETVMVSSVNLENNQVTVIRAPGSYAWPAGTKVARVFTASDLTDIQENIQSISESVDSANSNIELLDIAVVELESAVGDPSSGLVKELADEVVRATAAEQAENLRATTAENAIDAAKVNRTELSQVITDWSYSADGTKLLVTIARYNASNQQTSQYTKIIPAVTDETIGMMTPEAYNEISALRNDVMALQQQGGRFIGISFATKSALDSYVIPESVKLGDFTYVLDDETKEDSTTRYVFNGSSFDFAFVVNYDPIGIADTETPGLVKGSKIMNWAMRDSAANNDWNSVCYGDGLFVAVGDELTTMTSPDGIDWTLRNNLFENTWRSVCYGDGLFVAVGDDGGIVMSSDGINWTIRTSASDNDWRSVCYGNGLFVAVSDSGLGDDVMTSPDGIDWTIRTSATDNYWESVCYGNGLFVAVGSSSTGDCVMTSPDGIDWTIHDSAADNDWFSVCYGNGLFVAVGGELTIMTSPDGIDWTLRNNLFENTLRSVCYGNGLFVAVGNDGGIVMSSDSVVWYSRQSPTDNDWRSVCYGNGLFVAVGDDDLNNGINIMTSQAEPLGKIFVETDGTMSVVGWDELNTTIGTMSQFVRNLEENKANRSVTTTTTLYAENWVGSETPYVYSLGVFDVTETSNQEILPSATITSSELEILQGANITDGGQAFEVIILKAFGEKPSIDLPIRVIVRGDA